MNYELIKVHLGVFINREEYSLQNLIESFKSID